MKLIRSLFLFLFIVCSFSGLTQSNTLVFTVPIASIGTDTTITFSISDNVVWGCQINAVSLTGTLDGTVNLLQSNDRVTFNQLSGFSTFTLVVANGSKSFENSHFSHKFFAITLTKNGLTGGNVDFLFTYKILQ